MAASVRAPVLSPAMPAFGAIPQGPGGFPPLARTPGTWNIARTMKNPVSLLLWIALGWLSLSGVAQAQYRAPRDYMKRIEPQVPPANRPATPPAAAPGQPAAPQTPPPQLQLVTPKTDPAKAKAEQDATVQRTIAFETKRAEAGSASAQYDLGVRYLTGDGVATNLSLARRWLEAASTNGYPKATRKLDELKRLEQGQKPGPPGK